MKNSNTKKTMSFTAIYSWAKKEGYVVTFPDFPGCVTEGDTFEQAKTNAVEALELWIEELRASDEPIPTGSHHPIIEQVEIAVG